MDSTFVQATHIKPKMAKTWSAPSYSLPHCRAILPHAKGRHLGSISNTKEFLSDHWWLHTTDFLCNHLGNSLIRTGTKKEQKLVADILEKIHLMTLPFLNTAIAIAFLLCLSGHHYNCTTLSNFAPDLSFLARMLIPTKKWYL